MSNAKIEIQSLLKHLPDDCSIEDVQYHLYVLEKVRQGLAIANSQRTITQKEVEESLSKWLIE